MVRNLLQGSAMRRLGVPLSILMTACAAPATTGSSGTSFDAGVDRREPAADAGWAPGIDGSVDGATSNLLVDDDFEQAPVGGVPDPLRWTVVTPNCAGVGSLTVDGTIAHSGSRSVRVQGGGGYCDHIFLASTAAVASITTLYGRFFVRFGNALGSGHTTFAAFHDQVAARDLRMGGQNQVLMWNRESDDATLPAMSPTGVATSVAPAAGSWMCIEFALDGAAGTITTWVDGASVAGLLEDGTPTPDIDAQWLTMASWRPHLTDAKFGWESYAGQADIVWFDDIALGGHRIGCTR